MYNEFKVFKIKHEFKPRMDNLVFRLHYRYTVLMFFVGASLSTLYDFVGKKIICQIEGHDDLKDVVNTFCYINGTYTIDKYHYSGSGVDVPHPGVGYVSEGDVVTYHTYYQWVPFVLVAQGALFYLPHYIWKVWENNLLKTLTKNISIGDYLDKSLQNYSKRVKQYKIISAYIIENFQQNNYFGFKFVFCEILNILITVFTIYITNVFLGGEFYTYGIEVFTLTGMDPENRTDPMSRVFPQMGKCNFQMYGASGTVETRDVMCLLPTNVANEKIYIMLWLWLVILGAIGCGWVLLRIIFMMGFIRGPIFRARVLNSVHVDEQKRNEMKAHARKSKEAEEDALVNNSERKGMSLDTVDGLVDTEYPEIATKSDLKIVLHRFPRYCHFILFQQLRDQMDSAIFSEFIHHLASTIQEKSTSSQSFSSGFHDQPRSDVSSESVIETDMNMYPPLTSLNSKQDPVL